MRTDARRGGAEARPSDASASSNAGARTPALASGFRGAASLAHRKPSRNEERKPNVDFGTTIEACVFTQ